jgi:NADPH:quinone reductase-like Zn-dependent oxidoreductase
MSRPTIAGRSHGFFFGPTRRRPFRLSAGVAADDREHVIDYTREDFTRNGRAYDLILDLAGHRSASAYKRSLAPGGRYLYVGGSAATLLQVLLAGPLTGRAEGKKIRVLAVRLGVQHLTPIVELCQAAKIATVIDRRYPLGEVPEALQYLGEGHAKGKVVVIVD